VRLMGKWWFWPLAIVAGILAVRVFRAWISGAGITGGNVFGEWWPWHKDEKKVTA
jgi:hypothetical protein